MFLKRKSWVVCWTATINWSKPFHYLLILHLCFSICRESILHPTFYNCHLKSPLVPFSAVVNNSLSLDPGQWYYIIELHKEKNSFHPFFRNPSCDVCMNHRLKTDSDFWLFSLSTTCRWNYNNLIDLPWQLRDWKRIILFLCPCCLKMYVIKNLRTLEDVLLCSEALTRVASDNTLAIKTSIIGMTHLWKVNLEKNLAW